VPFGRFCSCGYDLSTPFDPLPTVRHVQHCVFALGVVPPILFRPPHRSSSLLVSSIYTTYYTLTRFGTWFFIPRVQRVVRADLQGPDIMTFNPYSFIRTFNTGICRYFHFLVLDCLIYDKHYHPSTQCVRAVFFFSFNSARWTSRRDSHFIMSYTFIWLLYYVVISWITRAGQWTIYFFA